MRITDCKEIIDVKHHHDYDYMVTERSCFNIFFPFSITDLFYSDLLSECVMCADLTFLCADIKHPSLIVYISPNTYSMRSNVASPHLHQYPHMRKQEYNPHDEIDIAIGKILGQNKMDAYLTTYSRNGVVSATVTIPKPYVTMDMVDDAPVLTMTSL